MRALMNLFSTEIVANFDEEGYRIDTARASENDNDSPAIAAGVFSVTNGL